jgi:hypothetical protein
MKKYLIMFLLSELVLGQFNMSYATEDGRLHEFTTDGCSGGAPNRITLDKKYDWMKCCIAHDVEYWMGGTEQDKKKADDSLNACVGRNSNALVGEFYEAGVSIGGSPELPTTWRWGYGWTKRNFWRVRNQEDQNKIDELKTKVFSLTEALTPNINDLYRQVISCVDSRNSDWSFVVDKHPEKIGEGQFKFNYQNAAPVTRTCHGYAITAESISQAVTAFVVSDFNPKIVLKNKTEIKDLTFNLVDQACTTKKDNESWPMTGLYTIDNKLRKACCEILTGR